MYASISSAPVRCWMWHRSAPSPARLSPPTRAPRTLRPGERRLSSRTGRVLPCRVRETARRRLWLLPSPSNAHPGEGALRAESLARGSAAEAARTENLPRGAHPVRTSSGLSNASLQPSRDLRVLARGL
ncbi:hypothetical protein BD413DRAFT_545337, partial [Trametes elegans]